MGTTLQQEGWCTTQYSCLCNLFYQLLTYKLGSNIMPVPASYIICDWIFKKEVMY